MSMVSVGLTVFLACCATQRPADFASPLDAVHALVEASENPKLAESLLGSDGVALLRSGDEVADRADAEAVRGMIAQRVVFVDDGEGRTIARIGDAGWDLPIPLVEDNGRWHFDVEAGRDEIRCRRIGRNELSTLATLHAIVVAQREYQSEGHDGEAPAFAAHWWSTPGHHDGLYWPVTGDEPQSPLGPLVAAAADEGYRRDANGPVPYHGYRFRLLTAQGPHAPGGAHSYVDANGRLTGGFAVLAWPVSHGSSGVMTFQVNRQGIVFQKDLGADTAALVAKIDAYDPDESWVPTRD